jgi:hypothetical protein
MLYIVACQFEHKNYLLLNNGETLERKVRLLKINDMSEWYSGNLYAPMIPVGKHWYTNKFMCWWDVIDEKCQLRVRNAIQTMDNIAKTEDDEDIVDWLKYWESKGAYFIQVGT